VTAKKLDDLWQEGFKAGAVVGSRCPYAEGTAEAQAWESGWLTGIAERERKWLEAEPGTWERVIRLLRGNSDN
jgi:hypothetical protein